MELNQKHKATHDNTIKLHEARTGVLEIKSESEYLNAELEEVNIVKEELKQHVKFISVQNLKIDNLRNDYLKLSKENEELKSKCTAKVNIEDKNN